ncbi:MAG: helix-turn-helix transcriptional regulator [archaeon]|nr:MAG: helix-turn-helix transcriptional regulator [archaeon]
MGRGDRAKEVSRVLEHPLRRKIIQTLGASGPLTWKELSSAIGTSTGALYHHLDVLEGLVVRDNERRYSLTGLGKEVYSWPVNEPRSFSGSKGSRLREVVAGILLPRAAIESASSTLVRSIFGSLIFSLAVAVGVALTGTKITILSVSIAQDSADSIEWFLVTVAVLFASLYFGSIVFKCRARVSPLVVSISAALVPLAGFSVIYWLFQRAWPALLVESRSITLVLVAFQALSLGILGAGVSVATGARIEKTLLGCLALLYVGIAVMPVLGVRFV